MNDAMANAGLTAAAASVSYPEARRAALEAFTQAYVDRGLALSEGNVEVAAARAGVSLRYFRLLRQRRGDGG